MQPHQPPIVSKKVLIPFVLITLLFALWGFANAVTDPMVQAFKKVLELSNYTSCMGIKWPFMVVTFVWHYLQRYLLGNTRIRQVLWLV